MMTQSLGSATAGREAAKEKKIVNITMIVRELLGFIYNLSKLRLCATIGNLK
jgi:hypothetical protein